MDKWLHCNLCLARPTARQQLFLITNCTHIFCSGCEKKATEPHCAVCKKKCSFNWIDDKLNPEVKNFFKPCDEMEKKLLEDLKKNLEGLKMARDIRRFQNKHMNMLKVGEKKKAEKMEKMFKCAIQSMEKLKKDNHKWKEFAMQSQYSMDAPTMAAMMQRSSPAHSPHAAPSPNYATTKRVRTQSPLVSYTVPNTPRHTQVEIARKHSANIQHSAMPNEFQRGKRVSLISPPVDGKLVSSRDAAQRKYEQRTPQKGIAGQMASRRPFSMMNVNESPIYQIAGSMHGQALRSPHTPSTSHSDMMNHRRLQIQQQQQWQLHKQGRQSTPISTDIYHQPQSGGNSPFAFPSLDRSKDEGF